MPDARGARPGAAERSGERGGSGHVRGLGASGRRAGGGRRGRDLVPGVVVAVRARERALEAAEAFSDCATGVGKALGAEHDEADDQDDDELHGADVGHLVRSPVLGLSEGGSLRQTIRGWTALRTASLSSAGSNAFGAGWAPVSWRMTAAWRASTCTIEPAAARTSLLLIA